MPGTRAAFDEYAADYDQALGRALSLPGESKDYYAAHRITRTAECVRMLGRGVSRILDFGCGSGDDADTLLNNFPGASLWGVDDRESRLLWPTAGMRRIV